MLSDGYYKHVEYQRRDPRTGKMITVRGGKTMHSVVVVNALMSHTNEHMRNLHTHLKKKNPDTEDALIQQVNAYVGNRYEGTDTQLKKLKNSMLAELFSSGSVSIKEVVDSAVQAKLDVLGVDADTLLHSLVPPGFSVKGELKSYASGLLVKADILQKGVRVGRFSRIFTCDRSRQRLEVSNDDFRLTKTAKGKGLGSLVISQQLDTIEKLSKLFKKATRVRLTATTFRKEGLVGAYVWPKLGFTVSKSSFDLLRNSLARGKCSVSRKDALEMSKSKSMADLLKCPGAKTYLTTDFNTLDCFTVLGSTEYKILRENLKKINAKHSMAKT